MSQLHEKESVRPLGMLRGFQVSRTEENIAKYKLIAKSLLSETTTLLYYIAYNYIHIYI